MNLTQKKYLPCYHSCKFCLPYKPDKQNHYCTSCNEDNNYPIKDEKNSSLMNCYPKCKYNYYFNSSDDYICIDTPGCPSFEQQKNSLHKGIEPLFPPFGRGVLTTRLMENLFFWQKKILNKYFFSLLILLFWYYLGCFCAVYKNTQFHFIKDTLISFGMGFITPFGTNIIIALLRIYSLKKYNKSNKIIFKLSKLLQQYL